jgi:DNA (cytosine-5)-methyltransferase 1
MKLAEIKPGELDILDGSPPCQGFSTAGKRNFNDSRNSLFKEYCRLLRDLQPKVFVFENVSGLIKGYMKQIYLEIIKELRDCGYKCKGQVLNAMYYNVPQSRERVIIIGVRDDLGIEPSHPKPMSKPIILKEVINDLKGNRPEDRLLPDILVKIAKKQPDKWDTDEKIYKNIKGNLGGSISLKWAGWERICQTIVKSEISITGVVHPDRERYLSLPEIKRIASFPDDFKFLNREDGFKRIGNSVPPLFMKAIAEHIRINILDFTGKKAELIKG